MSNFAKKSKVIKLYAIKGRPLHAIIDTSTYPKSFYFGPVYVSYSGDKVIPANTKSENYHLTESAGLNAASKQTIEICPV